MSECWDMQQKGFCPRVQKYGSCKYCDGDDGKGGGKDGKGSWGGKDGKGWSPSGGGWDGGKGWGGGKGWSPGAYSGPGGVWNQFLKWNSGKGKGKDQRKKIDPSRTIWVGNIPADTKFQELKSHVELSGVVPLWAEVYSGKGAGTGAIGFKTEQEAAEAVMVLNGTVFKSATLAFDVWEKQKK
ncbi:RNA-binding protein [Durusdinium trenchii]|uniref:RNA-binding protein n=1 Tax=Durusdinium trenchii TaxID=1381693 RepID=A0ABP0HB92_9DINO